MSIVNVNKNQIHLTFVTCCYMLIISVLGTLQKKPLVDEYNKSQENKSKEDFKECMLQTSIKSQYYYIS